MSFQKINTSGTSEIPEEYLCESTDIKITEDIVIGSSLYELDTQIGYVFDGVIWRVV